jgi:hypothetical protein
VWLLPGEKKKKDDGAPGKWPSDGQRGANGCIDQVHMYLERLPGVLSMTLRQSVVVTLLMIIGWREAEDEIQREGKLCLAMVDKECRLKFPIPTARTPDSLTKNSMPRNVYRLSQIRGRVQLCPGSNTVRASSSSFRIMHHQQLVFMAIMVKCRGPLPTWWR